MAPGLHDLRQRKSLASLPLVRVARGFSSVMPAVLQCTSGDMGSVAVPCARNRPEGVTAR